MRSSVFVFISILLFVGCKGTEDEQVSAAKRFTDAVARNDKPKRDSMVATFLFREYFQNQYVEADFHRWFRTFYDIGDKKFLGSVRVDVERKFAKELRGALIDTAAVEETGIVRATNPKKDEPGAYFWMVKQGGHWKVAIVTKGEQLVHFVPPQE